MNKVSLRRLAGAALVLVAGIVAAGCASQATYESVPEMIVERIPSEGFDFEWVRAERSPTDFLVLGDVARRFPRRGPIPGYVRVSVIGPDGAVLTRTDASLMRRNKQAQSAHFYTHLKATPPAGSTLRVEHITTDTTAG